MKKFTLFFQLLLLTGFLTSCSLPIRYTEVRGNGVVVQENRIVSGFNAIELSGIGTLILTQDDNESLEIEAEENIMSYLRSDVRSGVLMIGVDDFVNLQPGEEIIYRLSLRDLERISTSGLGKIEAGDLLVDNLKIDISGSGDVFIRSLEANRLNIDVSGVGKVEIAGTVDKQRVDMSGAGNYEARDLHSKEVDLDISGTGKATLWVTDRLSASLSGAGSIQYFGSPDVDSDISGLGEVKPLGEK